ncbi:MAG: hypothetical protein GXP27_14305 [Planctomycetes bacterium]|nr:hypothetical protein [Planctomycetota bacterium]
MNTKRFDNLKKLDANVLVPIGAVATLLFAVVVGLVRANSWMTADALWKTNTARDIQEIRDQVNRIETNLARDRADRIGRSEVRWWIGELRRTNPDLRVPGLPDTNVPPHLD